MLIACEYKKDVLTHKADTALERLDSITKEKNAQRQYDSALYYGHEEFKLAQKKSNIKFSEKALSRIITAHKNNKNYDSLFKKNNFVMVGEKKDWILSNGAFKNEFLFQLINE